MTTPSMPEYSMRAVTLVSALVSLGLTISARAENTFGPVSVPPAAQSFQVGALKLTALHDGQYIVPNDAKVFGVDVGAGPVGELLRAAGAPTDRITLSVNALLVRTDRRVLLLDTGIGPKVHGALIASLDQAGVAPGAVTDVLITHTHGDHVGGLLDASGHLAFPNATIRMASAEWAWLKKRGPEELVKTIADRVSTFEPGARIAPGITSLALDGHTPGHVGYEIVSGHSRLLDIGDLGHSSIVSLAKPQWTNGFDNDATLAKTTRLNKLAALAKDQELLLFSPHFPFPGVGHVAEDGGTFSWKAGIP
jgi:glyoxylase-like metal-dependent hydrolase (beta-lactamase superfamily II)